MNTKSVCCVESIQGTVTIGMLKDYLNKLEDSYSNDDVRYLGKLEDQPLCTVSSKGVHTQVILGYQAEFGLLITPEIGE